MVDQFQITFSVLVFDFGARGSQICCCLACDCIYAKVFLPLCLLAANIHLIKELHQRRLLFGRRRRRECNYEGKVVLFFTFQTWRRRRRRRMKWFQNDFWQNRSLSFSPYIFLIKNHIIHRHTHTHTLSFSHSHIQTHTHTHTWSLKGPKKLHRHPLLHQDQDKLVFAPKKTHNY